MAGSPKTRRQATACDWCRSHKVKCDTQQPSCRNCVNRGVACVTVNLRRPSAEGKRLAPTGRRSSRRPRASMTPRNLVNTPSGGDAEDVSVIPESAAYFPTPPTLRTFEARPPGKILPAIFATPFDSETVDEHVASGGLTGDDQPSTGQTSVTLVTDKSCFRRQAVDSGSSQYVLVQWLDLFFAQWPTWTPIFPFVQQGLAYSLDVPLPFTRALPGFPADDTASRLTSVFFSRIYPIFPIIELESFQQSLVDVGSKVAHEPEALVAQDYPQLACIYAVFSVAADEEAGNISPDGTRYLEAAYSMYAQLVAAPYLASAQALLLLTFALRNRNKDGASWSSLSQAICIVQSLGLHRHVAYNTAAGTPTSGRGSVTSPRNSLAMSPTSDDLLGTRVWWIAYTLERTMALETGRPSLIREEECDQMIPSKSAATTVGGISFDYFHALIRLARIKARAISLLYGGKTRRKPVRELLVEMAQIDRALVDWADSFPESIRPGRDLLCGANELHLATYISMHYHQTMIALHRPALMSAVGFLHNRINEYFTGTPWHNRLRFSLCIGVASARSMLKAMNDLKMYAGTSRVITANQIFVAILVLGIYTTKVPVSLMNDSDLALLSTFSEQIEDEYIQMGQDPEFSRGLKILRQQLHEYNDSLKPGAAAASNAREASVLPQGLSYDASLGELDRNTEVADLEESWSYLWNEDVCGFLSHSVEQDMANMYLLGLPQSWA